MFRINKAILISLTVFMVAVLTACSLGQAAQPTPTPIDLTAIYVTAMAAAKEQMTLSVPEATNTFTPTIPASETATEAASNTPGIVPIEETSAVSETPTSLLSLTSTQTPVGGATAIPSFTPFGATAIPSFTPVFSGGSGGTAGPVCKNATFGGDLDGPTDVQDGDVLSPWEKFTKGWIVNNTGTCRWDEGFTFKGWIGPPSLTDNPVRIKYASDFVEAGQALIARVKMYAPGDPGEYIAHWSMFDDQGKQFGGDFTVYIKVVK